MHDHQPLQEILNKIRTEESLTVRRDLREELRIYISYLILEDFNKLVRILYTIDVAEEKLKQTLNNNPQTEAAILIADLLIQRQEEKLRLMQSFKKRDDIPEEDKW